MNSSLNSRSSLAFTDKLGILPLPLTLIALSSVAPSSGQGSEIFKCPDNTYTFSGNPEQTLCEQYPNFICAIEVGDGPFPKSSLIGSSYLSGNICVVGNFEVDVPFTFLNAVVKIDSGVTTAIKPSPNGYDPGSSLGIDNSKLFACNELWKGITLGHLSSISTQNSAKIEDAETAISATGLCALFIRHTTFNRNRVGIELNNTVTSDYRKGIRIGGFALNAVVNVNNVTVAADMEGTTNKLIGIHLEAILPVEAGTKIHISDSKFWFRAKDSEGIFLYGTFPDSSSTQIWGNSFKVSNITLEGNGRPSGIKAGVGDKNNLSIKWNTFTSYSVHTFPPGVVGVPQHNEGIELGGNTFGMGNEVSANTFNYDVQSLHDGLFVYVFQHTKYCSNIFRGFGLGTAGAYFVGFCPETDFRGNIFEFAGENSLYIRAGTQIGIQSQKGNEWHNLFGIEPDYHARCLGDPSINKFIVHTPQSTCANELAPCFSKYHPRIIEPDFTNEFFGEQLDTPLEGCNDAFTGGGTDELDRRIALGTFVIPFDDPALGWVSQRYLYHKFKNKPDLTSEHTSFPAFMAGKENTTVGKFYEVHSAIENALRAGSIIDEPSRQALSGINDLMDSMAGVDEAIEQQGLTETLKQQKWNLIYQLHDLNWVYDSLRNIYKVQVVANLQAVYNLNQAIATTQNYEINEKTVNQIRMLSIMQQSGELTEDQVSLLQAIAQQDPKQGGPAVYTALGMLQSCARPEMFYDYLATPNPKELEDSQMMESRNVAGATRREIAVSPNPASTSFTVYSHYGHSGMLTMFDVSGREWLKHSFSAQEVRVDLKPGIPSGVYLLRFDIEGGTSSFQKLVVQSN